MADTSGLMKILLIGGAVWVGYELFLKPSTAAASASGTPTGTTVTPTTAPATPPVSYNTPDQIYQRLVANVTQQVPGFKASPGSFAQTSYQWKFYLDQVSQTPSGLDFSQMFPAQVNPDGTPSATPNLTLGQFWSTMAPWLTSHVPGMSGIGLAGIISRGRR